MIKNYFLIAWRNMRRNKVYAFINLAGLGLGLACAILIFCLVKYHLSFDDFHADKDRIYRVVSKTTYDVTDYSQGIPSPFGKAFRNDYSYAENVAMRVKRGGVIVTATKGNTLDKFKEDVVFAEPSFFEIFNFPTLAGNIKSTMETPDAAAITAAMAQKLFPGANAIGKQITVKNKDVYTIKAILKNIPVNSDNQQQIYLSYASLKKDNPWLASDSSWSTLSSAVQCFVKLKPGVHASDVEKVFPQLIHKYCAPVDAKSYFFYMQPLGSIHFDTRYDGKIEAKFLWALGLIGLFLIITASINFINLSTAQSLNRSKEVGVRKTMGSSAAEMFAQFMGETSFMVLIAIAAAVFLSVLALPYFNDLFDIHIPLNVFYSVPLILFLGGLFLLVSFLSGYYPSLMLSRFNPVQALKGKITQQQAGGLTLRRGLIIMQFAIVQLMIIGSIVVSLQMRYSMQSDLGFNKDNIVLVSMPGKSAPVINTLRSRILQIAGVENVSFCSAAPMSDENDWNGFVYNNQPKEAAFQVNMKRGDSHYLSTYGLKLLAGRNISASDTVDGYLINETMMKKLNIPSPAAALLKTIKTSGHTAPIVGVVKDFHNESFHTAIEPICIFSNSKYFYRCAVKLPVKSTKAALAAIQKIFADTFPDNLYSYSFLDKDIAKMYETETSLLQMIEAFVIVAILIGCMGLYGLVSFMAVQKRKEIGVRRVLGASAGSVLWLFAKEFAGLLIFGFLIAAPCAWLAMNHWLQDFVYRIHIDALVFIITLFITSVIAILAVGYTSLMAASANPVKSLRAE